MKTMNGNVQNVETKDHNKMNVTRRTCGYLGENFWNEGKTKEIKSKEYYIYKINTLK